MTRDLDTDLSVLLFDSDINYVKTFLYPTPLAYAMYGVSLEDCLDVGCFSKSTYQTVEEYQEETLKREKKELMDCFLELSSFSYYIHTEALALDYYHYSNDYYKVIEEYVGHFKRFKRTATYSNYTFFFKLHPELQKGYRFDLDCRFRGQCYEKEEVDRNGNKRHIWSVKGTNLYSYDDYVNKMKQNLKEVQDRIEDQMEMFLSEAKADYEDLVVQVIELLKTHERVGLIGYHAHGVMKEVKGLDIHSFTLMDYLKVKDQTIYWFYRAK